MTYLHRPITPVSDLDPDSLPARIELDPFSLCDDDSARLVLIFIKRIIEYRKVVVRWNRKVTTV